MSVTWRPEAELSGPWGSPHTGPAWLIALSPIWSGLLGGVIGYVGTTFDLAALNLVAAAAVLVLIIAFASADRKQLRSRGFTRTPPMVAIVIPLVYLIMRVVRIGRGSVAPLVTYAILQLGLIVLGIVSATLIVALLLPTAGSHQPAAPLTIEQRAGLLTPSGAEASITEGLASQGVLASVTCEPFSSVAAGTRAQCSVQQGAQNLTLFICVTPDDAYRAFEECGTVVAPPADASAG